MLHPAAPVATCCPCMHAAGTCLLPRASHPKVTRSRGIAADPQLTLGSSWHLLVLVRTRVGMRQRQRCLMTIFRAGEGAGQGGMSPACQRGCMESCCWPQTVVDDHGSALLDVAQACVALASSGAHAGSRWASLSVGCLLIK